MRERDSLGLAEGVCGLWPRVFWFSWRLQYHRSFWLLFFSSSFVARTGTDVQWRRGRQDGAADGGRAAHELFCMTLWKSGEGGNGFARGWWEFLRVALAL